MTRRSLTSVLTSAPTPGSAPDHPSPDPWVELRRHTPARIALGRAGSSLPTAELLRFGAAHAQARDAVHVPLDAAALGALLQTQGWATCQVHSCAADRAAYLRRPDWGRQLDATSAATLSAITDGPVDLAIVLGDGLSAVALQRHAGPLLADLRPLLAPGLRLAPLVIASQARVALADAVGERLQARLVLMLLGERPGLSSPDSLGAYLTYQPRIGRSDAERNCVSNIRPDGLAPAVAAQRLAWLLHEALQRRLSGVALKDDSATALLSGAPASP